MTIPYRTQRALRRLGLILLVLLVVGALVWLCWAIWIQRFVYYTREDGAQLNYDYRWEAVSGEPAVEPETQPSVSIYYNEGDNVINVSTELTQMVGYYVDAAALAEDAALVRSQLQALPEGTPVMLELKSPKGEFFYSSEVAPWRSSAVDIAAVDELISFMKIKGLYMIAKMPALRDYLYFEGNKNLANGIHHSSRQYLWADADYCYWLDPAREGTVTYLVQIVSELKKLGFDEVVLGDFRIPDSDTTYYDGDRQQAVAEAAQKLVTACATEQFAVSFVGSSASFALPVGRCRLYLQNVAAADAAAAAQESALEKPDVNLVFLTEVHDTRFDAYSVLRPLAAAH